MEGSDLKNKLETVFGENTVIHMMTGKAVQKALKRHLVVDNCLHNQLVKKQPKIILKCKYCWIKPANYTIHFLMERLY